MKDARRSYAGLIAAVVVAVALIDQATKAFMVSWLNPGEPVAVIGEWFRFKLLFNPGAAFSMGSGSTWLFTVIQIVFIAAVAVYAPKVRDPWLAVGLGLIAGGAAGNLFDRLARPPAFFVGHVVDFISVGNFAVFNLADAAITIGVVVFIAATVLRPDPADAGEGEEGDSGERAREVGADA